MSIWRFVIGAALAGVPAPVSCLPAQPPAPPALVEGPQEVLLGANAQRAVLARAIYPPGTRVDAVEAGTALPTRMSLIEVAPGVPYQQTWLQDVFERPLRRLPISDGRWLIGVLEDGTTWQADLDDRSVRPLAFGGALELWRVRDPWLIGRDAGGPFAYHLLTQQRTTLPADIERSSLVIADTYVAYLRLTLQGSKTLAHIQLFDLNSGQAATVAQVRPDAQLFVEPAHLTYITYDPGEDVYYVRGYVPQTGATSMLMRILAEPEIGNRQTVIDVGPPGYMLRIGRFTEDDYAYDQLIRLRRSGEHATLFDIMPELPRATGQPRYVDHYLIFYDQADGAWTFADLSKDSNWREYLFRGAP